MISKEQVRIAIIDNGINKGIFHKVTGKQINGYHISGNTCLPIKEDVELLNHGTICSAIVAEFSEESEIANISIFGDSEPSVAKLCVGLKWCLENRIDIICMSTGIIHYLELGDMPKYIKKLTESGIIIVAAFSNSDKVTYPASFPEVVAVRYSPDRGLNNGDYCVIENSRYGIDIECSFPNSEVFTKLVKEYGVSERISNSLVTPYIAGYIATLIADTNGTAGASRIKNLLKATVKSKKITNDKIEEKTQKTISVIPVPVVGLLYKKNQRNTANLFLEDLQKCFCASGYCAAILCQDRNTDFYKNIFYLNSNRWIVDIVEYSDKLISDIILVCLEQTVVDEDSVREFDIVLKTEDTGSVSLYDKGSSIKGKSMLTLLTMNEDSALETFKMIEAMLESEK